METTSPYRKSTSPTYFVTWYDELEMEQRADHLLASTEGQRLAVSLPQVIEVMRPLTVAPIETDCRWVVGASVLRGVPCPIVDVAVLWYRSLSPHARNRWISVRTGRGPVAIAVDEVLDVRHIGQERHVPPVLSRLPVDAIDALTALDDELAILLHTVRLVPDDVWLELAEG